MKMVEYLIVIDQFVKCIKNEFKTIIEELKPPKQTNFAQKYKTHSFVFIANE